MKLIRVIIKDWCAMGGSKSKQPVYRDQKQAISGEKTKQIVHATDLNPRKQAFPVGCGH